MSGVAASRFRRPSLGDDFGYVPGEPVSDQEWTRLNTNESPLPPAPGVAAAVAVAAGRLRRYPHPLGEPLRSAIARHHAVEPENVVLGNGADDILNTCFRAFCEPGFRVVMTVPTYPLLHVMAAIFSVDVLHTALPTDAPDFAGTPAPLRFLVNPNSPTGTWIPPDVIGERLRDVRGVVVVDEAYADFAPASCVPLAVERPNWLVVRTFSKSYALAGLRVGYAVGAAGLINDLTAVKDPYPVDRCAIAGAGAALDDEAHHRAIVTSVTGERLRLTVELRALGWDVLASHANFVFARPPASTTAEAVTGRLREQHILVRRFPAVAPDRVRITCGTPEENARFLDAIR